ncbi:MAG TPA: hypothetical protein VF783_16090 [Terriglobales bacterium]
MNALRDDVLAQLVGFHFAYQLGNSTFLTALRTNNQIPPYG